MLEPGAILGGKLRIERILGEGGMGVVAVATHLELDQRVAVKVLHDDILKQPEVIERFIREARASARLKSEHVCKVHDVGRLDSGAPYLVMELLEGEDLGEIIEHARLREPVAADFVLQACVAIAEAHAHNIIHRDLKPRNLFVTRRIDDSPLVKVLDFGIAKAPAPADAQLTKTTTVIGSPGYMSPEQLRSARDVDARSDIWSLGVILYECTAGRLPFASDTLMELAVKIAMDPPVPLEGVEPRYAAIVMKCLEKDAANRYQTVAELASDLAALAELETGGSALMNRDLVAKLLFGKTGGTGASSKNALPTARTVAATGTDGASRNKATQPPSRPTPATAMALPRKSRAPMIIAAILGLAVVSIGAAFALGLFASSKGKAAKHKDAGVEKARPDAAVVADAPVVFDTDAAVPPPVDAPVAVDAPIAVDAAVVHVDAAVVHVDAAVPPPPRPDAAPEQTSRELVAAAREAMRAHEYGKALADAEAALKKNPNEFAAHGIAANAACELGNKAAAERHAGHFGRKAFRALARKCAQHGVDLTGEGTGRDDDDER